MKILVLGGTGAIGVEFVKIMHRIGNEVYVTSRIEHQSKENLTYLKGDAHDTEFLRFILSDGFDAIVDFMNYSTDEFGKRVDLLLNSTKQYVFLSSSRVYADSKIALTEKSERLLDVCKDEKYVSTDEYALAKARQENILMKFNKLNWTIIRPYITYSNIRLQLGIYEKEQWLYRALKGRTILFSKDIAAKYTTLTYGEDVANIMIQLVGNKAAYGEVFHIAQPKENKWEEVLKVYLDMIQQITGKAPRVLLNENSQEIKKVLGGGNEYQLCYDRLYNRKFNGTKVALVTDFTEYIDIEVGLKKCLEEFVLAGMKFRDMSWQYEGYADKMTDERTPLKEIPGIKGKVKYLLGRYTKYYEKRKI